MKYIVKAFRESINGDRWEWEVIVETEDWSEREEVVKRLVGNAETFNIINIGKFRTYTDFYVDGMYIRRI